MTLTHEEVAACLEDSSGWELDAQEFMTKQFTLPSFGKAIAFVDEIARLSEDRNHHPQITIDHKKVTLRLRTMDVNGLTQKDVESAYAFDRTVSRYLN
ncbi:4a-hydroxytetrahydrobiopterin dehydratase [Alteribacter natronophilus]|uniref:4a-hydroxytetrahydrobiopterin dehydratase n=1 Tax=Alteribacter natronophilus TaxID=2583810 RepID=UPI00110E138F|nr:4a-hydroxytetrahydrobiopterin dehydratase [Alteribacter natronophilus]TMW71521.1 4a-hydroxytetrahydrobiopterin dehydratase [Alteribacter natronophilus]